MQYKIISDTSPKPWLSSDYLLHLSKTMATEITSAHLNGTTFTLSWIHKSYTALLMASNLGKSLNGILHFSHAKLNSKAEGS